mmetsp:Transcript_8988/g.27250  ORF Transcript_8988/g.27250 Transcript_8988/m.27250 type:complete len:261 (-) Transcript_8988:1740-2522(-)
MEHPAHPLVPTLWGGIQPEHVVEGVIVHPGLAIRVRGGGRDDLTETVPAPDVAVRHLVRALPALLLIVELVLAVHDHQNLRPRVRDEAVLRPPARERGRPVDHVLHYRGHPQEELVAVGVGVRAQAELLARVIQELALLSLDVPPRVVVREHLCVQKLPQGREDVPNAEGKPQVAILDYQGGPAADDHRVVPQDRHRDGQGVANRVHQYTADLVLGHEDVGPELLRLNVVELAQVNGVVFVLVLDHRFDDLAELEPVKNF